MRLKLRFETFVDARLCRARCRHSDYPKFLLLRAWRSLVPVVCHACRRHSFLWMIHKTVYTYSSRTLDEMMHKGMSIEANIACVLSISLRTTVVMVQNVHHAISPIPRSMQSLQSACCLAVSHYWRPHCPYCVVNCIFESAVLIPPC